MIPSQGLISALQELRAKAVTRRIDLTRSFEEALGNGQEKELGIMHKGMFKTVMSALFGHMTLTMASIDMICDTWAAGDPGAPGGSKYVRWKKFATDFDSIPPPALGHAPSRHFTGVMDSDVFSRKPGRLERREGRQPHGDLRSASDVHFGGPEEVRPLASIPHGTSEEITRSSVVIRGPEGVTEEEIQSHVREAAARNPFAGLRNQTTLDVAEKVKPLKALSPTRQKHERGSVEFTDEPIGRPPEGCFYDKFNQVKPFTCFSGAPQHSTIYDKLRWDASDDEPVNEHTIRGRRTYYNEDNRASQSVMRNVLTMKGGVPRSVVEDEFPRTRLHHPDMFKSTIQGEAMSWNPPDNVSPFHRPLPSWSSRPSQPPPQPALSHQQQYNEPYASQQQYAQQEPDSAQKGYAHQQPYSHQQHYAPQQYPPAGDTTWGQMDMQGALRAGGAPAQYGGCHPHAPSAVEQQYVHLQQHMREQLQQEPHQQVMPPAPHDAPYARPPIRFSSVAPAPAQATQANLYSTSSSRIGPPSNGPPPPKALYSDAFAERARIGHSFTDQFAAVPRGGTGLMQ